MAGAIIAGCASLPPEVTPTSALPAPKPDTRTCPELHPKNGMRVAYPGSMLRDRREGWVVVGFDVQADGTPGNLHVVSSNPGGAFDAEALKAISHARFTTSRPYRGCESVVEFRLPR